MKFKLSLVFFFLCTICFGQHNKIIEWINQNAISLTDTDFKNDLAFSKERLHANFINAQVFGFGEATHHSKEFFEVKSKFFKYLVLHQDVKVFVLEESFGASYFINEYLQGNDGDLKVLMQNLQQGIWQNQELFELISWMKSFNDSKTSDEKIRFYGNDCMFNYGITTILKEQLGLQNMGLSTEEQQLIDFYGKSSFLKEEKSILEQNFNALKEWSKRTNSSTKNDKLRSAFTALEQFATFLIKPSQETRDWFMAEIVENLYKEQQSKIFVWAHNGHINKTVVYKDKTPSMGNLLHQKFKEDYYAMGFEFGVGKLMGYDEEKKAFDYVTLEKPLKNTNSEFFFDANRDVFFIDFAMASQEDVMKKFLSQKRDYIQIGGYGLILKYVKYNYASERLNEMYDGLIYIKKISPRTVLK
ncbi:erythromycin esterase family protein [Flavobacterium sp. PLA-1-15]|uniref:erythromycin esterase family protein n=1 Tax=Flavobacterium sp. PLA-1-15 TaxID=3380533 RepID=UPI003B82BDF1